LLTDGWVSVSAERDWITPSLPERFKDWPLARVVVSPIPQFGTDTRARNGTTGSRSYIAPEGCPLPHVLFLLRILWCAVASENDLLLRESEIVHIDRPPLGEARGLRRTGARRVVGSAQLCAFRGAAYRAQPERRLPQPRESSQVSPTRVPMWRADAARAVRPPQATVRPPRVGLRRHKV
jgi:hypothetical protein